MCRRRVNVMRAAARDSSALRPKWQPIAEYSALALGSVLGIAALGCIAGRKSDAGIALAISSFAVYLVVGLAISITMLISSRKPVALALSPTLAKEEGLVEEEEEKSLVEAEEVGEADARFRRLERWVDAPRGQRRFIVEDKREHPLNVHRLRAPKGRFTDEGARVEAALRTPGGEIGLDGTFEVAKPFRTPSLGGAAPRRRAPEAADPALTEQIACDRALDRFAAVPLLDRELAKYRNNPMLIPLDGYAPPLA